MPWFQQKQVADEDGFYPTEFSADSLVENEMHTVKVNDTTVVIAQSEGDILAFDNTCPHAAANLADGSFHRGRVSCPDHSWKFDVRTGRILWPDDEMCRLKRYDVRIVDGRVWIRV